MVSKSKLQNDLSNENWLWLQNTQIKTLDQT